MIRTVTFAGNNLFFRSVYIQKNVLFALLMREIITRYGRRNLGLLWLFVEPLLFTLLITALWSSFKGKNISDINIVAFVLTGWPLMMMWRNSANRMMGAINANIALLYHRNVRPLDVILSRILLEVIGATVAQIAILSVFVALDIIARPNDIFYMLCAWFSMAFFSFGLGLILCVAAIKIEFFSRIWSPMNFVLMPLSGAFIFVNSLPQRVQEMALWVPMIHGSEMFRHGYFTNITTYENIYYLWIWNISLIFLGLMLLKRYAKDIEL